MSASNPQSELGNAASEWRTARRVYAIYSGVIAQFDVGVPPCPDIESPIDRQDPAVRGRVRDWLSLMDDRCPVTFLRQVLQRDATGNEATLRALIRRHLERPDKTEFHRDKLDFLLVQYFTQCVSENIRPAELTVADVGKVLQPVLGQCSFVTPVSLKEIEELCQDVSTCHSMEDLEEGRILERGREIKAKAGDRFFEPSSLIAFTRYNIILRRAFFYAMRAELDAVRMNVALLEKLGVEFIDATRAGLSDHETMESVGRVCLEWRKNFRTDYSAAHILRSVKELRACTDGLLAEKTRDKMEESSRQAISARARKSRQTEELGNSEEAARVGLRVDVDVADPDLDDDLTLLQQDAMPEVSVQRSYRELIVDSDPVGGTPARYRMPEVLDHIQAQFARAAELNEIPLAINLEHSAIHLASWENRAFVAKEDASVLAIRSSVAARLILQEAFDDLQDGHPGSLSVALAIAHCEAGRMQEVIAKARDAGQSNQIIYLAATAQRLLELIREAEFAGNQENL